MISRHILLELSKATAFCVLAIALILLYGNLSRYEDLFFKAVEQDPKQVIRLCLFLVPYALSMAIPFGFTLALALVIGNWASNREILAVKSLGISPNTVSWPFWLFSILLSIITIFTTLQWGPQNRAKFDKLREQILWQNFSHLLVEEGEFSFDINSNDGSQSKNSFTLLTGDEKKMISRVSLSAREFTDNIWKNLRITLFDHENRILMVIHSGKTLVEKSLKKGLLSLDLYDVDLEPVHRNENFFKGSSDLFLKISHWQQPLIIEVGKGEKKNFKRMGFLELFNIVSESESLSEQIKAKSILHKNVAMGCSPFFVCLLLLPISTKIGREETILNLFLGIVVCISFYTLGTIGSNFFEKYSWSYFSWWIPNVFFLFLSILVWRKIIL